MAPRFERFFKFGANRTAGLPSSLCPGGKYHFLIGDLARVFTSEPYALDLQIREDKEAENAQLMFYHGSARVLIVRFERRRAAPSLKFSAGGDFADFKSFSRMLPVTAQPRRLRSRYREYLSDALKTIRQAAFSGQKRRERFYWNRREAYWQNRLCRTLGSDNADPSSWLIIDRESQIGFESQQEERRFHKRVAADYEAARAALQNQDAEKWGTPSAQKVKSGSRARSFGLELDLLALGRRGELLCIELKHGSYNPIYWVPLQAAVYRDAFAAVNEDVADGVSELVRQKVKLGLLPQWALKRLPVAGHGFPKVDALVVIAEPRFVSDRSWEMLAEVLQSCPSARMPILTATDDVRIAPAQGIDGVFN